MANGYNNPFMAFYEKPRNISNVIGQGLGMYADSQNQKAAEAAEEQKQKAVEAEEEQKQVRAFAYMTKASELASSDPAASEQAFMLAMKESPEFVTGILQAKKMRNDAKVGGGSGQREFESLIADFTPEEKKAARRVKAGLAPRAVGSSALTIAETDKTELVAESTGAISGEKKRSEEIGKAEGRSEAAPIIANAESFIASEVQKAKIAAKSTGESVSQLKIAKASLPAIKEVTDNLIALSSEATSTTTGRVWDAVVKEAGFGSTSGATARAEFIAIVDNQVLPLLKQTFGAAFTASEGDALKKTLGDPNASPAEKRAQINAFISGKIREIETMERETATPQEAGASKSISWDDM